MNTPSSPTPPERSPAVQEISTEVVKDLRLVHERLQSGLLEGLAECIEGVVEDGPDMAEFEATGLRTMAATVRRLATEAGALFDLCQASIEQLNRNIQARPEH